VWLSEQSCASRNPRTLRQLNSLAEFNRLFTEEIAHE
jgi:hypothetical protein